MSVRSGYSSCAPSRSKSCIQTDSSNRNKVYYRLLTYSAPYTSFYPISAEDASLSFLHDHRIPLPGLGKHFIEYICSRECIHPSRAKLYISNDSNPNTVRPNQTPSYSRVGAHETVSLRVGGCGYSKSNPLIVFLDIDPEMDRIHASQRPSVLERGGKRAAKVICRGYNAVQNAVLAFFTQIQKVPKGME